MGMLPKLRAMRGQALTEVALLTPLAILMVLGGYDLSVMGSNKVIATSAVRNGARIGSQLGGVGTLAGGPNTCSGTQTTLTMAQADQQIVDAVLAATGTMTYLGGGTSHAGFPDEIDVYSPAALNGKFAASDPYESYVPTTSPRFGSNTHVGSNFTMAMRCQGPLGSEAEIGVRMLWTYKPANGIPGPNFVFDSGAGGGHLPADWAVEKLMLCSENCVLK
jgi:hypothetical protein